MMKTGQNGITEKPGHNNKLAAVKTDTLHWGIPNDNYPENKMKTVAIIITLLLIIQNGFCQDNHIYKEGDCEVVNGRRANCGNDNNKNGYWIYYKTGITGHTDFVSDPSHYVEEKKYLYLIAEGNYADNSKTGKWLYYSDYKSYEKQYIERISFYDKSSEKDSVELEYFNDSILKSKTYWNHGIKDSVRVFYLNGQTKFEAEFTQCKIRKFRIYYQNGGLKYSGENIKDFKIEDLKYYDTEGQEAGVRENDITMIAIPEDIIKYID